jgi:hypothetical protein
MDRRLSMDRMYAELPTSLPDRVSHLPGHISRLHLVIRGPEFFRAILHTVHRVLLWNALAFLVALGDARGSCPVCRYLRE